VTEPVLVTGATGFIGRALVARLKKKGHEVIALGSTQGDIADPATLVSLRNRKFACVFHLAGLTYVPASWGDPDAFRRINVGGTENVLSLCSAAGAPLVYMSGYVYGVVAHQPISEEVPPRPNNPYAESKLLAEQACRACASAAGVKVTVLRPFNVYGPGQAPRFLVPTVIEQVLRRRVVEVLDLEPRRDWVFVEDVAEAAITAAQRMDGYRVYNIGSGVSVSVGELITRIQALARTRLPVRSMNQPRTQEIADTVAEIAKAKRELGWSPATSLDHGLRQCIEAMKKR
jgi:GDP-4-dehydro-6-deoxy-D-mannose reductase